MRQSGRSSKAKANHASFATQDTKVAEAQCSLIFALTGDMEEPLAQALALADALDLMGFGLRHVSDDHGAALIAIAEALSHELKTAQNTWRKIMITYTNKSRVSARRQMANRVEK